MCSKYLVWTHHSCTNCQVVLLMSEKVTPQSTAWKPAMTELTNFTLQSILSVRVRDEYQNQSQAH